MIVVEAETLAGLFGLGGALVGAAVSTGAVIWQQRKTAEEGERTHLLSLSEAAAIGVIQITYRLEDHFADGVPHRETADGNQWRRDLKALLRMSH